MVTIRILNGLSNSFGLQVIIIYIWLRQEVKKSLTMKIRLVILPIPTRSGQTGSATDDLKLKHQGQAGG